MRSRLVYTTTPDNQTVTIDYNQTLRLFLTDKEQRPFSAEKLLQMLNYWARIDRIESTALGRLHITATGNARCVLTSAATNTLSHLYLQRRDWQIDYPFVANLLACGNAAS